MKKTLFVAEQVYEAPALQLLDFAPARHSLQAASALALIAKLLFPLSSFLFALCSFVIPSERSDEGSFAVTKRE